MGMAQFRKEALTNNCYYHVYSRSIAKFVVFNNQEEYDRFYQLVRVYRFANFNYKYSHFLFLTPQSQNETLSDIMLQNDHIVDIVAYCFMPTHIHLVLKQIKDKGIAKFMSRVLNGYSRFFNTKHQRTGPLWSGRFKSVLVSSDEQLLHLTRYLHLNPTSAGLVDQPNDWQFSSYEEYLNSHANKNTICSTNNLFDITPKDYERFVLDGRAYQRDLSKIKALLLDNYTG